MYPTRLAKASTLALMLLTLQYAFCQPRVLMLQKQNRHKNVYYKVGDELTFYRQGVRSKIKDVIVGIEDSTLVFRGRTVSIKEIVALHIDEKTRWWLRYKAAQLLLICGAGYLTIDAINNGELNKNTLLIGGTMIAAGTVCKLLIPNKIKITRRTKLRILTL